MKGDIALAGILFSAEDWSQYDPIFRAELMAAASSASDPWVVTPATGVLSGPIAIPRSDDR
jgi:hypothetical protein